MIFFHYIIICNKYNLKKHQKLVFIGLLGPVGRAHYITAWCHVDLHTLWCDYVEKRVYPQTTKARFSFIQTQQPKQQPQRTSLIISFVNNESLSLTRVSPCCLPLCWSEDYACEAYHLPEDSHHHHHRLRCCHTSRTWWNRWYVYSPSLAFVSI